MSRGFLAAIATFLFLGSSAGVATAANIDPGTQAHEPRSEHDVMRESCLAAGTTDRDRCMVNVKLKDSGATRECEDLLRRAQRRCMLDWFEAKHPLAGAK